MQIYFIYPTDTPFVIYFPLFFNTLSFRPVKSCQNIRGLCVMNDYSVECTFFHFAYRQNVFPLHLKNNLFINFQLLRCLKNLFYSFIC